MPISLARALSSFRRRLTDIVVASCFAAFGHLAATSGVLAPLDSKLNAQRMEYSPLETSGSVVFVAIDPKSLDELGSWPLSRNYVAAVVDGLHRAGAAEIFVDIDLSTHRTEDEDRVLEQTLERVGGGTYLAAFEQAATANFINDGIATSNFPLPRFAQNAWPVTVNVPLGEGGHVTDYFFARELPDQYLLSVASAMSGILGDSETTFPINYAFDPTTIPTISFSDVANERIPAAEIKGKSFVIGAQALELRDNFAVPVHGIIPGAVVHILATETLTSGRIPYAYDARLSVVLLWFLALSLQFRHRKMGAWSLVTASAMLMLLTECGAFAVFRIQALQVPSGLVHVGLGAFGLWRLSATLTVSQWRNRQDFIAIQNSQNLIKRVFEDSSDVVCVVNEQGEVLAKSARAKSILTDQDGHFHFPEVWRHAALDAIRGFQRDVAPVPRDLVIKGIAVRYTVTPSEYVVAAKTFLEKETSQIVATISGQDVTETLAQSKQLEFQSRHDDVTGALRRQAFQDVVSQHMSTGQDFVLIAFNLARFGGINTTVGRTAGDLILKEVVDHARNFQDRVVAIGRLDDDSFLCVVKYDGNDDDPLLLAEDFQQHIQSERFGGAVSKKINATVGYSHIGPEDQPSAADFIDRSIAALDFARSSQSRSVCAYDADFDDKRRYKQQVEEALDGAISRGEFSCVYQPQYDITRMEMNGVEALIRWHHPELGHVSPEFFIPIAEATGHIYEIGRYALDVACSDARNLPENVQIAVNVSAAQMGPQLVGEVAAALRKHGIAPSRLCLELTETTILESFDDAIAAMLEISKLGPCWALDDFGMGFSSFGYLSQLPIKKIKLDKHFTQTLDTDDASVAIVEATVTLCRGLNAELLCEGLETERQLTMLLERGCHNVQGYLLGRPAKIEDILETLAKSHRRVQSGYLAS